MGFRHGIPSSPLKMNFREQAATGLRSGDALDSGGHLHVRGSAPGEIGGSIVLAKGTLDLPNFY